MPVTDDGKSLQEIWRVKDTFWKCWRGVPPLEAIPFGNRPINLRDRLGGMNGFERSFPPEALFAVRARCAFLPRLIRTLTGRVTSLLRLIRNLKVDSNEQQVLESLQWQYRKGKYSLLWWMLGHFEQRPLPQCCVARSWALMLTRCISKRMKSVIPMVWCVLLRIGLCLNGTVRMCEWSRTHIWTDLHVCLKGYRHIHIFKHRTMLECDRYDNYQDLWFIAMLESKSIRLKIPDCKDTPTASHLLEICKIGQDDENCSQIKKEP